MLKLTKETKNKMKRIFHKKEKFSVEDLKKEVEKINEEISEEFKKEVEKILTDFSNAFEIFSISKKISEKKERNYKNIKKCSKKVKIYKTKINALNCIKNFLIKFENKIKMHENLEHLFENKDQNFFTLFLNLIEMKKKVYFFNGSFAFQFLISKISEYEEGLLYLMQEKLNSWFEELIKNYELIGSEFSSELETKPNKFKHNKFMQNAIFLKEEKDPFNKFKHYLHELRALNFVYKKLKLRTDIIYSFNKKRLKYYKTILAFNAEENINKIIGFLIIEFLLRKNFLFFQFDLVENLKIFISKVKNLQILISFKNLFKLFAWNFFFISEKIIQNFFIFVQKKSHENFFKNKNIENFQIKIQNFLEEIEKISKQIPDLNADEIFIKEIDRFLLFVAENSPENSLSEIRKFSKKFNGIFLTNRFFLNLEKK